MNSKFLCPFIKGAFGTTLMGYSNLNRICHKYLIGASLTSGTSTDFKNSPPPQMHLNTPIYSYRTPKYSSSYLSHHTKCHNIVPATCLPYTLPATCLPYTVLATCIPYTVPVTCLYIQCSHNSHKCQSHAPISAAPYPMLNTSLLP